MKIVNCPPYAPVLMESTRAIGYSIDAAIADIIDNSIAANATQIEISYLPYENPYVAILDNGKGMTSDELTEAMRYGSSSPTEQRDVNDLGRYGLGLKTASLSQCRCLTVATVKDDKVYARRWDLDYILKTGEWSLIELDDKEIRELPEIDKLVSQNCGTVVIWSSLDKIKSGELTLEQALESKMTEVKNHLELVFHRYLSGDGIGKITMLINGVKLVPFDPFFVAKSTTVMDDEKIEIPGREGKVIIRPYILPHTSKMTKIELEKYGGKDGLRKLQGFYIYRNKRLLTWGTWFRLLRNDEFSKLARVRVDIPNTLDDLWTLDIKKSTAYPPGIVKTRLKQLVVKISNGSKRTWSFRRRKETDDNITHVWSRMETREGIRYFVNQEHPLLTMLNEHLDKRSKILLKSYLETVQNNLPLNNLHFDISTEVKIAQDNEKTELQRVKDMARAILQNAMANNELDEQLSRFELVEPFMEYMDEIQEIYEEVRDNG